MKEIFKNLSEEFILIGLTGAVGSGSTTSANILSNEYNLSHISQILDCNSKEHSDFLEIKRVKRIKHFYSNNHWNKFYHLKVSNILFAIIFASEEDIFKEKDLKVSKWFKNCYNQEIIKISKEIICDIFSYKEINDKIEFKKKLEKLDKFIIDNVDKNQIEYTQVFQKIGTNLRRYGKIHENISSKLKYDNLPNVFFISETVRRVCKLIGEKFITIDALRNTYEIQFFKNRYSNFYLFSIVASETVRKNRLKNEFDIKSEDYKNIKEFEYDEKETNSQNINSCICLGDIFINNDSSCGDKKYLEYQIFKYLSLIRKPGLFTPNDDERNMQVALTARYSSGCISRQVGACVTGPDGYIKGIGWNDVQEGNTPCIYRTLDEMLKPEKNEAYSEYEKSDFSNYVKQQYIKRDTPFCFKDIQNKKEIDNKLLKFNLDITQKEKLSKLFKNPTRERALHAEENAFLQVVKTGGQSIVGGTLYSTASPCQLCAKKSMQLKIKRIVYIDAYPDISITHTLKSGREMDYPSFDMFEGVSGNSYFKLFRPIIGIKEELK